MKVVTFFCGYHLATDIFGHQIGLYFEVIPCQKWFFSAIEFQKKGKNKVSGYNPSTKNSDNGDTISGI
jgi:hypothetical protein